MILYGSCFLFHRWLSWLQLYSILGIFNCLTVFYSRFVLNSFPKFVIILSFFDWAVVSVALSMFCIVLLNTRSQCIAIGCFMFSRSVVSMVKFFLILLLSASTVMFPATFTSFLLTSQYFLIVGKIFLSFVIPLCSGNIVTGDQVSTMISFRFVNFDCQNELISSIRYVFYFG